MRSILPRFSLALALGAVALGGSTIACTGSADEDVGDQEGAWRAKPNGEDSKIGAVLVDAPAPPPGTQLLVTKYTVGRSKTADLGTPIPGLSAGEVFAEMTGTLNAYPMIKAGATTTIHLGGVVTTRDPARPTVGLTLDGNLAFSTSTISAIPDVRATTGAFNPGVSQAVAQAVPAGTYVVRYGFGDGATVKVTEGAFATLDLTANAGRRIARVTASPAELPSVMCAGFNQIRGMRIVGKAGDGAARTAIIPIDKPFEVGQHEAVVKGRSASDVALTYTLPCLAMPAPLPLGSTGAGPLDLKLGRLDVDDIAVTQNDGSVRAVRGKYQVYDKNGNGMLLNPLDTNTGVDLPPGTYDVVATYTKTDGTSGQWKSRFTTP